MAFLVSDTSVIIDLDRGELLEHAFKIGEEFAVPDVLFERELDDDFGARLCDLGLKVEELSGVEVGRATMLRRAEKRLSIADSFAFALAHSRKWTLLTGDAVLRGVAQAEGVAVHGVLWVVDRIEAEAICDHPTLHTCLSKIVAHTRCRLPKKEIDARLKKYGGAT